ncbi:uncharacterized protein LOC118755639 [Rhagoletis pomonella]|uniref:uncharacterized protein LOC118755635 n=1 Tax=Rhagoletis pomonella TaxID=28610 RepID=UPI00177CC3A7|nr:uncharacterized protein LOC118755635 [Rhagoletis pomonella]XP_036346358.1 uncharacterized protein LOC118755639 [Rhagoletis pomonella]
MEALDILEKRIDTLSRILGPLPEGGNANNASGSSEPSKPTGVAPEAVVDSLLSVNSMLNGVIGNREQIAKAMARAPELEKYLDPNFLEENQQVRSKEVYLNAVAPDLHAQFDQLDRVKQLEPTLGAEYFRSIPGECTEKLKQHSQDNAEFAQQAELIEESLILAMKRYGEIQTGLLESLGVMNKRLEAIEEKMEQKKRTEAELELPVPQE